MLLRKKIPLVSILIMSLSLLIMNVVYYAYISDILIEDNKSKINQVLSMESISLETYFNAIRSEVNYLSNDALVIDTITKYLDDPQHNDPNFKPQYDNLNAFFEELKISREDIRDAFVLTPKGLALASSHPDSYWIDLSDRQYFIDAMNGMSTISDLLLDRMNNQNVLITTAPIYSDHKKTIIGVMASVIDTTIVSNSIRALVDDTIGNACLIDQNGMIIFHTDSALIGTKHFASKTNSFFTNTNPSLPIDSQYEKDGISYYVTFKKIPNTLWTLVIDQNMDVITNSANNALYTMSIIALSVLLISALSAIIFARKLTIPITELSRVMHKTTRGDLSVRSQYVSASELGRLSSDLNYMLDELTGAYEEVESKNDILVATEEELRQNYEQLAQSQAALEVAQERYANALHGSRDVVWEWAYDTNHFFVSELWYELTGLTTYSPDIILVAFEELADEENRELILNAFKEHWKTHSPLLTFTFSYLTPENKTIYFLVRANTHWNASGKPVKTSGIMVDITFEKEINDKIHDLAFNSQITSLPNRHAYMMKLKSFIEAENSQYSKLTVFQMDIDNFMRVNDALGHSIGNELLMAVANRLKSACNHRMCVFHLSADEFAFILADISEENEIIKLIKPIYQLLNEPFIINNKSIYISMSTGISVYPNDTDTVDKLIQNADTAMFAAKRSGKSNYVFYTNILSESVQNKLSTEELLRRAIKDKLLAMHYQPQYAVKDQQLHSFEALMRLTKEDKTSISPAHFIPIAEEYGLIVELGEWALIEVCKTIKELLHSGYDFEHISVNVSSIQLQHPDFVATVSRITQLYDIKPQYLELEVTESVLLSVVSEHNNTLSTLRNMGYKIALDDFGTGYSSFSYLRTMPLSTLKIDKTFIDDLADSKKDQELVRQMIELSHELGINVIAEGVETKEQYLILKEKGCDFIQGYYFSKPLDIEKTIALLAASHNQ